MIQRLMGGYKDESSSQYPAATINAAGCALARKALNRDDNGYVQIAPIVTERSRARRGEELKEKGLPQRAHRLAVLAYKSDKDVARLLGGDNASHLCHQPTCINPDHLVVETKEAKEARKACKNAGNIIRCSLGGHVCTQELMSTKTPCFDVVYDTTEICDESWNQLC
ncbi:hypothetical protein G7054_g5378 [Neopestalotiopsis clavispora]|nr:hypothetical protein G7054_g5378 [Neopestalotiopsis clavispora]